MTFYLVKIYLIELEKVQDSHVSLVVVSGPAETVRRVGNVLHVGSISVSTLALLFPSSLNLLYRALVTTLVLWPGLVCCFVTPFADIVILWQPTVSVKASQSYYWLNSFLVLIQQIKMEGLEKLRGSRKAYRSYLMRITESWTNWISHGPLTKIPPRQ